MYVYSYKNCSFYDDSDARSEELHTCSLQWGDLLCHRSMGWKLLRLETYDLLEIRLSDMNSYRRSHAIVLCSTKGQMVSTISS
jgi:hypothetical protein